MRSASAPFGPLIAREVRALLARWHLWAALAVLGAVQAALCVSAAPLDGARPLLVHGLLAAWLCALPVAVACGAADDRAGANQALLLQLGHGTTRVTLAKLGAALVGALILGAPVAASAALLATRDALPALGALSFAALVLGLLQSSALALFLAAMIADTGWAALATLLAALGWLWLDLDGHALDVAAAVASSVLPLRVGARLLILTATLVSLAAIGAAPTASGERRTVRSLIALAIGGVLLAAAGQLRGSAGAPLALEVRARAAEATALGELDAAALAIGALFVLAGLVLAWRRR